MTSQCHLVLPGLNDLKWWWGGPPGPQPTPTSACWVWMNLISLARSGSRGTRADQGVCPTTVSGSPVSGNQSGIGRKRLRHRLALARFGCQHAAIESRRLPARDAQRMPVAVFEVLGKQDNLSAMIRVMSNLTINGLHHRVGFAANGYRSEEH